MTDAELEEHLIKLFERRWKILLYGLNIWLFGWLCITISLFALTSIANGR